MGLLLKEFQLQQIVIWGMGGLFLAHLAVLILRKAGHTTLGFTLRAGLESFWLLWLVVPWLAGSLSVAEERRLGTMEGHLCLPISTWRQFLIKLLFVLLFGAFLSPVLLWTAESIGAAVGAASFEKKFATPFSAETLVILVLLFSAISLIALYASTLARNILQALAISAVTAIFFGLPQIVSNIPLSNGLPLWRDNLVNFIEWPILVGTLVCLGYPNFRRLSESWRVVSRNVLMLVGTLVSIVTLTATIYHRDWELLTPLEPPHGPPRLSMANPPILVESWNAAAILLPDGRLWVDRLAHDPGRVIGFGENTWLSFGGKWDSLTEHHFADGSDWVAVSPGFRETVGIRSDGTLWVSADPLSFQSIRGRALKKPSDNLVQMGKDRNWKSVVDSTFLLKNDGSLWWWGAYQLEPRQKWPGLRWFQPQRVGTDSDWAEIVSGGVNIYGWKKMERLGF